MNPPPLSPTNSDDKIWIILCHLSLLLGVGFILPLVVYLAKKQDASNTADHAREALNFHISVYAYAAVSGLLCLILIGIPLLVMVTVASIVCSIVAVIKASNGEFYRYPLIFRLV